MRRRREALASKDVHRPKELVVMNVRNQSSRKGVMPDLIVLHDTESPDLQGASDLRAVGNWFDNPRAVASAHVCVDGDGNAARYVPDERKAWHVVQYNSRSLGIEQIGYASFSKSRWSRNEQAQLKKVAQYIAYWHKKYDIPIRDARSDKRAGVVTHASLGTGGGHYDPGPGYPLDTVLALAKFYSRHGFR